MKKKSTAFKRITFRSIIIGILVIVFFVGIIFMYYNMVYKEKRESIILSGKMAAIKSADQFDRYLSTNIDMINLTGYTLDGMITNKKTDPEIQEYLVGQSTAIKSAVQENSTGLYAYINGRFFSGTNWIPPEGYDSTTRPWYIKPMSNPGQLTILEPYLDVQSGNTMLALGKSLCDGVSVISVDVSLDQMQKLTEEAVNNGISDIEMILTGDYTVVTHSDINEVGKNYREESGTLAAAIAEKLPEAEDDDIEFTFEGKRYIIYDAVFKDDWHCVSVNEATEAFASINRVLVATIVVTISFGLFTGAVLVNYNRRNLLSERAILANEAKSSFLSNMSHEIRTPINAMLGMNEMILRESNDSEILSFSESIKAAGNSLLGIVNDILDFSRIESGKMEIIPVKYDLSEMLNDLANLVKSRAEDKGLELVFDFDKTTPKNLYGDVERLKQVISNILTNAVKYTEKGSVTLSVSHSKKASDPDSITLKIAVQDTGIGIKEEDLERLYTEFERIDEKRNRNIEGTGLGMSITKGLLEMMGSSLKVESVYGKGSKFSFEIEQNVLGGEILGEYNLSYKENLERHIEYKETFRAPKAEILVVDDNPMNLMVFGNLLKRTEVRIDMAVHGDEALEMTSAKKYDIIFMDHMMPNKDGVVTLHELRAKTGNPNVKTPVICLTANAILGAREQYLAEGFEDYMTKPIDAEKLEGMLLDYLPSEKVERILIEGRKDEDSEIPEELEVLKSFKEIDLNEGIKNSGSADSYISLLRIFYKSMDEKIREIEKYRSEEDLGNYTIKVHALKSSARIIGAAGFSEKAEKLEHAGKSGDMEFIREHHASFMREFETFREPLSTVFKKKTDDTGKPLADEKIMNDAYSELKSAAEEMDCDRLGEVFDSMEEYCVPEGDRDKWEKLKERSDNFDYDGILNLL